MTCRLSPARGDASPYGSLAPESQPRLSPARGDASALRIETFGREFVPPPHAGMLRLTSWTSRGRPSVSSPARGDASFSASCHRDDTRRHRPLHAGMLRSAAVATMAMRAPPPHAGMLRHREDGAQRGEAIPPAHRGCDSRTTVPVRHSPARGDARRRCIARSVHCVSPPHAGMLSITQRVGWAASCSPLPPLFGDASTLRPLPRPVLRRVPPHACFETNDGMSW
jgi:hypothetical protein